MSKYKVPINNPNWILADYVLAPSLLLIIWVLIMRFESYAIYAWLAEKPFMLSRISSSASKGFLTRHWIDFYVLGYKQLLFFSVFFVGTLVSFNTVIPGLGRQLFIIFRRWQVNRITRTRGMRKLDRPENPLFPPKFNGKDDVVLACLENLNKAPGSAVLLGIKKRFRQDIEHNARNRIRAEKITDYSPFVIPRTSRFRHVGVVAGTGLGKTASVIGPMMRSDILSSLTGVFCVNPKGDEYLLRVAVDPVIARRDNKAFKVLELEYQQAQRSGETKTFAQWAIEVKNTSTKPFALISFSNPSLSLAYDPLSYGDPDAITKKIIYSSEAIQGHEFFRAKQEGWLQSFLRLVDNDEDLKGRIGLKHVHWFTMDPKKRLGEALVGIVNVDAEIKFPYLAEKIRRQKDYDKLISKGEKDAAKELAAKGLLSKVELEKIQSHDDNRNRFRTLCSETAEVLGGLSSHISQFVEDQSISGIFTESDRPAVNFRDVLENGGVIYVEVPTQNKGPQARALARMLMMELQSFSADRDSGVASKKCDIFAFIDEFGSLVYDEFINFIDKARSSKIGITLAHQSLGNLSKKHLSDSFGSEVLDNTATKLILGVQGVETQKYFQAILGDVEVLRASVTEAETKSTGMKAGFSKGISKGHSVTKEFVVSESDLNCPLGFGFGRVLDENNESWRGAISFNYLPESSLISHKSCISFLADEQKSHPTREKPYYVIAQNGRLIDPLVNEEVRAGLQAKLKMGLVPEASEVEVKGDEPTNSNQVAVGATNGDLKPHKEDDIYAGLFGEKEE